MWLFYLKERRRRGGTRMTELEGNFKVVRKVEADKQEQFGTKLAKV